MNVSVVMATYNGAKYLKEQLDSILIQTLPAREIIVADDCSTDNTWQLLHEYALIYPQIKLYQNPINLGYARNFANAISYTSSELIAFADQDDIWLPHKLESLANSIGDNWLIHSDASLIDECGELIAKSHFIEHKDKSLSSFTDYLWANNVTGCTMMVRRELLDKYMPIPKDFYSHDHYLALCAADEAKIVLLDQVLIKYRQHGNNTLGAGTPNYAKFKSDSRLKALSFEVLDKTLFSSQKVAIKLIAEYRRALADNKLMPLKAQFKLLKINKALKYLVFAWALYLAKFIKLDCYLYERLR